MSNYSLKMKTSVAVSVSLLLLISSVLSEGIKLVNEASFMDTQKSSNAWQPEIPKEYFDEFFLFRNCTEGSFENPKLDLANRNKKIFFWNSIAIASNINAKKTYFILGGNQKKEKDSTNPENPIAIEGSGVLLCTITKNEDKPYGLSFDPQDCKELENNKENVNIGASVDLTQTEKKNFLLSYCDPLWDNAKGQCFIQELVDDVFGKKLNYKNLCEGNSSSCMAGFSSSFGVYKSFNRVYTDFWIGAPTASEGNLFKIDNPFSDETPKSSVEKIGNYLGFSVAPGFASAPSYLSSYKKKNILGFDANLNNNWLGGVDEKEDFFGAGFSMIKIKFPESDLEALVVGAPHANTVGVNSGRIYLYCLSSSDLNIKKYDDYLDGPNINGFFGYSLSNIGKLGSRYSLIAVGQPFLGIDESGKIFIIKVNKNCSFIKEPLQIIKPKEDQKYFGMVLPKRGIDINFDGTNDLMIPYKSENKDILAAPITFLSRPIVSVKCKFLKLSDSFYSELISRSNPLKLTVVTTYEDKEFFKKQNHDSLFHVIDPDSTKDSKDNKKRFKVVNKPHITFDNSQYEIHTSFEIVPEVSVSSMDGIDNEEDSLVIKYRAYEQCKDKDCSINNWHEKTYIDWSDCFDTITIPRFVCPPHKECKADVVLKFFDEIKNTTHVANKSNVSTELIYGDSSSSKKNIVLELINHGPTSAGHIRLQVESFGNIKISKIANTRDRTIAQTATFASVLFDEIKSNEEGQDQFWDRSLKVINIETYYDGFNEEKTNFTIPSGLSIKLKTGTVDPNERNNEMKIFYKVVNNPNIRISEKDFNPNHYENVTYEELVKINQIGQRTDISRIGPSLNHIYEVEHRGSQKNLEDVTIKIKVPIQLKRSFISISEIPDNQIFYFFKKIHKSENQETKEKYALPTVTRIDPKTNQIQIITTCKINEDDLNPQQLRPLLSSSDSLNRKRRSALIEPSAFIDEDRPENLTMTPKYKKIFRRTLREVFHCGREGMDYGEPICTEIVCKVDHLNKNEPVQVSVEARLWARTFFRESLPDFVVVSSIEVDQGKVPEGVILGPEPAATHSLNMGLYFTQIKPRFFHYVPIWPVILGICAGVVIISLIAVALYRLGFFKRSKRHELLRRAKINKGMEPEKQNLNDQNHWKNNPYENQFADDQKRLINQSLNEPDEITVMNPQNS